MKYKPEQVKVHLAKTTFLFSYFVGQFFQNDYKNNQFCKTDHSFAHHPKSPNQDHVADHIL